MWSLNVKFDHLRTCIQESKFGLNVWRNFEPGDWLLLKLNKHDAEKHGMLGQRIEYAILFKYAERDADGRISKELWGDTYKWIIHGSKTIRTDPFSFETPQFSKTYTAFNGATYINKQDEDIILSYKWYDDRTGMIFHNGK